MDKRRVILQFIAVAALLSGCNVKDPIFNTAHPDHGMVTLTTDWSGIGQGAIVPESYAVTATKEGAAAAGYTATLTGITNKLDHLFEPGNFRFRVYSTPEHITITGSVASVNEVPVTPADANAALTAAGAADNPERIIHSMPDWLFFSAKELSIVQDTEQTLTIPMEQQVRELTLIIEPADALGQIESITGALMGVAGSLDLDSGSHSSPATVLMDFTPIESGPDAGKWTATVQLLGVAGERQQFFGSVYAVDNPNPIPLSKTLTEELSTFNDDKRTPLTLTIGMEMQPGQ